MNNDPYNPQQPQQQPEVIQPQSYADNNQAQFQQGAEQGPVSYGAQPAVQNSTNPQKSSRNKKLYIGIGVGTALLGIILAIALLASGGTKQPVSNPETMQQSERDALMSPAKAIDIEQISNSISQDLSSLNDDSQLPPNRIDDKTLGL